MRQTVANFRAGDRVACNGFGITRDWGYHEGLVTELRDPFVAVRWDGKDRPIDMDPQTLYVVQEAQLKTTEHGTCASCSKPIHRLHWEGNVTTNWTHDVAERCIGGKGTAWPV